MTQFPITTLFGSLLFDLSFILQPHCQICMLTQQRRRRRRIQHLKYDICLFCICAHSLCNNLCDLCHSSIEFFFLNKYQHKNNTVRNHLFRLPFVISINILVLTREYIVCVCVVVAYIYWFMDCVSLFTIDQRL